MIGLIVSTSEAHNVPIARAIGEFGDKGGFKLTLSADVSSYLIGAPTGDVPDEQIEELRKADREVMLTLIEKAVENLKQKIRIVFDGQPLEIEAIKFPAEQEIRDALAGDPTGFIMPIEMSVAAPAGSRMMTVQFPVELGTVAFSIMREGRPPVHQVLEFAQVSWPYVLGTGDFDAATELWVRKTATGIRYLVIGFEHILPKGTDHILFVLGLFLLGSRLGPLLWQVTAFTVAHSVTLGLCMYGVISLPGWIVESLIAASICFVAVENILTSRLHFWRPIIVFIFGLLHGMGFAGVLMELGLPRDDFVLGLITFNVGVEFGQLTVITGAMLCVGWFRQKPWYRAAITIPASCLIAAVGAYWTVTRLMGH